MNFNINFLLITVLVVCANVNAAKEEVPQEKNLESKESSTNKPEAKSQKVEEIKPEKPFESSEIKIEDLKNGTFANVSDCLYFYQRGGEAIVRTQSKNRTEQIHYLTFDHKPFKYKGKCSKNGTHYEAFILLRFKLMNDTKEAGNFRINATFVKNRREHWEMKEMWTKVYNLEREFKFDCKHLETPIEFSYSCRRFSSDSISHNQTARMTLKLNNLQIQPFYNRKVFADSFDCSTLFTLGSWMGLIVMWTFTLVVGIGAYSLINIKTMDRFDNAKGKSIINVAVTDQ